MPRPRVRWTSPTGTITTPSFGCNLKRSGNGVYAFVLEGEVTIGDQRLGKRDGFGMWEMESFEMTAASNAKVLLMEVPMSLG